jgi:hypothetical protein
MGTTFAPTGPWKFKKHPQYLKETNYGVADTGTAIHTGALTNLNATVTIEHQDLPMLGKYGLWRSVMMGNVFNVELRYMPTSTDLQKRGSALPAGTGTNEESITITDSQTVDGVEKYEAFFGSITTAFSYEITREGINVTHGFECKDLTDFGASQAAIGTNTITMTSADPTNKVFTGITSGPDPFTLAGNKENTARFKYDATWGIAKCRPTGTISVKYLGPASRRMGIEYQLWLGDSTAAFANLKNYDAMAVEYIVTPNVKFSFDSIRTFGYARSTPVGGTEYQIEAYTGLIDGDITIVGTTY